MKMRPMKKAPKKMKMILVYVYYVDDEGEVGHFEHVHWHKKSKKWTSGPESYDTDMLVGWWPLPKKPKVMRPNGKFERFKI